MNRHKFNTESNFIIPKEYYNLKDAISDAENVFRKARRCAIMGNARKLN